MNIEYRKLELTDYSYVSTLIEENLKEVINQSFKGYFNFPIFFNRAMQIGNSYIIYSDESPCGFFWYIFKGRCLHINTIVIDKKYQGKGIGTSVFKDIETLGKSKGYFFIELGVQGINKQALKFYKNKGFKEISYTKDFDTYYMHKKI
jgi:ribosomal protein S18 acetylase RimI-like enzyme